MERPFVVENERSRKELASLAGRLSDAELEMTGEDGWSIGVIFSHLAFWDRRTIVLLNRWKESGVSVSPVDIEVINDSLLPLLKAIPPRDAVALALEAVEAVDREIEGLPDELVAAIEALGDNKRLGRYIHRQMHVDQIQKVLSVK